MKKQDNLHQLIHSLTKAEKRTFKLQAAQNTKNDSNNYILLFDAIDKQKIYNEDKLKIKFKGQTFISNISKTRYLLYHSILRTLRHLDESKNLIGRLATLQHDVRILVEKAMYEQAYLQLQKAERIAREGSLNNILLEVLDEQRKVLPFTNRRNINKRMVALAEDRVKLVKQYSREVELRSLLDSVTLLYATIDFEVLPQDHNILDAIWSHHHLNDEAKTETFLSKVYFYEIQAIVAQAKFDFVSASTYLNKARSQWGAEDAKVDAFRSDFIRITAAYVLSCINAGIKCANIDQVLDRLRWMPQVSRQQATHNFFLTSALDFIYSLTNRNIENCKIQLFTIKELIEGHQDKIDLNWKIILYYHIAIYHFLNKDYEDVLLWLSRIREYEKTAFYPHIHNYCKLIGLIVQYEMEDYKILEVEIEKTCKYLEKGKRVKEVEQAVLKCVRKLLQKHRGKAEERKAFSNLRHSIMDIEASNTPIQPLTSALLHHWINHKLQDEDVVIMN